MVKNTFEGLGQIRPMQFLADIDAVLNIWLSASIAAHDFIPAHFWQQQVQAIKEIYLPQTQNHVYAHGQEVLGFYALQVPKEEGQQKAIFLHALFVHPMQQGKGIGSQLLKHSMQQHKGQGVLSLSVYCANKAAVSFYEKHGFKTSEQSIDSHTQQPAQLMSIDL